MSAKPWLFITPGEPAGIGPDLVLQLACQRTHDNWVVIADANLLAQRARQLQIDIPLQRITQPERNSRSLQVYHVPLAVDAIAGQLNPLNAPYVLACLDRAMQLCQQFVPAAMVTGPLHKGVINQAGIPFSGHTEYLADKSHCELPVMMLATEGLRVALATTHLPLRNVAESLTKPRLLKILQVLHQDLQQRFAIAEPRIAVCGLNPHAGESGHLGLEEQTIIEPVIEQCRQSGMQLSGPLPADTAFTPGYIQNHDAFLAMYHDQGLPVLKHVGFGQAVNITLGLPFIRTSVDHGTALDLAGHGKADTGSLQLAMQTAQAMLSSAG